MAKKIRFYLIIKSVKFMHRWPIKKNFVVSGKERGKKKNLANRLADWTEMTEASYMVFLKKISNRGFLSSLICLKLRVSALETRVNA